MKITEFTKYRDQEEVTTRIETRDQNNNITEDIDFDEKGNQLVRTTYEFNDLGKATIITQYDEDNQLIEKNNTEYDENGKVSSKIIEFPDGSLSKEIQTKKDNSILLSTEDEDGEFEGSLEHILDENGMTKELIRTNFMGKIDSRLIYEYDEQKNTTKIIEQEAKGHFIRGFAYQYDQNKNRTVEEEINKKGQPLSRIIHKYEGNILKSSVSTSESTYFYYEDGLLTKEENLLPDGSADVIVNKYENKIISLEKHYSIPQGESTQDEYLLLTKRYLYED